MKACRICGGSLAGLLALVLTGPLHGQGKKDAPDVPGKPVEINGQAPFGTHNYRLEKGTTYRITVRADGFDPILAVRNQFGTIANGDNFRNRETQAVFTPMESRDYQIVVNPAPRGNIEKGEQKYTLLIEKANFAAEGKLQEALKLDGQSFQMNAAKLYSISVKSLDFAPEICVVDGTKTVAQGTYRGMDFGPPPGPGMPAKEKVTTLTFKPARTGDFRVLVSPVPYFPLDPAKRNYTTTIAELKTELAVSDQLTRDDPKYKIRGGFHKVHEAKLMAGKTYQIDLMSTAFDSFLFLEDSAAKILMQDDDSGGNLNARIVFRPTKTDTYRLIATTFGGGPTGAYTLTVVENPSAQPGQNPFTFPNQPNFDFKDDFKKAADAPVKADLKPIALKAGKDGSAEYKGDLANDDARYQGRKISKVFLFGMEAGKTYRIDLASQQFDAYLYLEEPAGKVVEENDDNGESLDSRIVYKAEKSGDYRIVATSLGGAATGAFTLKVGLASETEIKRASINKQLNRLFIANPEERKQTVREIAKYLEEKGTAINQTDVGLAIQVSQILEMSKDIKGAGEATLEFAKLIGKSEDPNTARASKMLAGVAKRLTLVGNPMQVKGKTLEGKDFDLDNLKGKVVLVDFWATWCGPCIAEIPNIKKMHAQYNPQGFEVIGISLDNGADVVKKFLAKEELPWPIIIDNNGKGESALSNEYGVLSIPLAILVGRDGRVVSLQARGPELTRLLEELMNEKK